MHKEEFNYKVKRVMTIQYLTKKKLLKSIMTSMKRESNNNENKKSQRIAKQFLLRYFFLKLSAYNEFKIFQSNRLSEPNLTVELRK